MKLSNSDNCNNLLSDKYPDLYQHRFCDQEDFSIVICGGENDNENLGYDRPFLLTNFNTKTYLPRQCQSKYGYTIVSNASDLYVVGDREVKSYSYSSKIWNNLPDIPYSISHCVCSFMQKCYIIIGRYLRNFFSCKFYDKINNKWCDISDMKVYRMNAACTVFEGKIVVYGGFGYSLYRGLKISRMMWSL